MKTEEEIIKLLKRRPNEVRNIKNPTAEMCIAAVETDPFAIMWLDKKDQINEVCFIAFCSNPKTVLHIKNEFFLKSVSYVVQNNMLVVRDELYV